MTAQTSNLCLDPAVRAFLSGVVEGYDYALTVGHPNDYLVKVAIPSNVVDWMRAIVAGEKTAPTTNDYSELHRLIHGLWDRAGEHLNRDDPFYSWIREARDGWVEICAGLRKKPDETSGGDPRRARELLQAIVDSATSVPAPYHGHAMDPVNDLRLVSGRRVTAARAFLEDRGTAETTAPTKGRAACDCKRDGMGMMRPCPDKPDDRYCRLAHQRCEHCPEETLVEHLQRQEREESSVKASAPPNEGASREAPSKEPM